MIILCVFIMWTTFLNVTIYSTNLILTVMNIIMGITFLKVAVINTINPVKSKLISLSENPFIIHVNCIKVSEDKLKYCYCWSVSSSMYGSCMSRTWFLKKERRNCSFKVKIPDTITRPAKCRKMNWCHSWRSNILFNSTNCNRCYFQFIIYMCILDVSYAVGLISR